MVEPWNDPTVLPPPVLTYFSETRFDIDKLKHTCNNILQILSNQSPLHQEGAILSRLIYKYDKKFRLDVGYRNIRNVNTALKKYLKLNLIKYVEQYISVLVPDDSQYVPTKQMLQFLLVRIITFSKLMCRINVCCKVAAVFYLDRIKRGESHWMSLMPYALLCRIWSISTVLIHQACDWYKQLHSYLNYFQEKGLPFLPEHYNLPQDLSSWLDIDNIDCHGRLNWAAARKVQVLPVLNDFIDIDDTFDIFKYVNNIYDADNTAETGLDFTMNKPFEEINSNIQTFKTEKTDTGQVLSRETFKLLTNTDTQNIKDLNNKQDHQVTNVTNSDTLTEFINNEEILRNNNDQKALTNHLSFMQWESLKRSALSLCDGPANRKLERKFSKLWKDKCLYYM